MANPTKGLQELRSERNRIEASAGEVKAKAIALQEAGDNLGAAKEAQRLLGFSELLEKSGLEICWSQQHS